MSRSTIMWFGTGICPATRALYIRLRSLHLARYLSDCNAGGRTRSKPDDVLIGEVIDGRHLGHCNVLLSLSREMTCQTIILSNELRPYFLQREPIRVPRQQIIASWPGFDRLIQNSVVAEKDDLESTRERFAQRDSPCTLENVALTLHMHAICPVSMPSARPWPSCLSHKHRL